MEKRRLFKMTEIEQNMLGKALADLAGEAETSALQIQVRQAPKRKAGPPGAEPPAQLLSGGGAVQRRHRRGDLEALKFPVPPGPGMPAMNVPGTFHVEKGRITANTVNHIKAQPLTKSLRGQDKGRG